MAKSSKSEDSGGLIPEFVQTPKASYNSTVTIQSVFPANLRYVGAVSGKVYEWPKSGDTVSVDAADVPDLLSKRIGARGCCGNELGGNVVFQVLQ